MHTENDADKKHHTAAGKWVFISIAILNAFLYSYFFIFGFLFFKDPDNLYYYGIPFFIVFLYSIYSIYAILAVNERIKNLFIKPYSSSMWMALLILATFVFSVFSEEHQAIEYITDFHGQAFGAEYVYAEFMVFLAFAMCAIGEVVFIDMVVNIAAKNIKKLRFNVISIIIIILFALTYFYNMPRGSFNG